VAFIVEDGTGIEDSNAYVDKPFAENYLFGERLAQFKALSDDEKEAAIIAGSQFVDVSYEWKGTRSTLEQGLSWPRDDVDFEGHDVIGIPAAVKKAACEAAYLYLTEEGGLFSNENDKEVARERIEGAVDISYVNPKDKARESITRFEVIDKLVRDLIKKPELDGPSVGSAPVVRT